jgi:hypothetical protein
VWCSVRTRCTPSSLLELGIEPAAAVLATVISCIDTITVLLSSAAKVMSHYGRPARSFQQVLALPDAYAEVISGQLSPQLLLHKGLVSST